MVRITRRILSSLPCTPDEKQVEIGVWGQRHLRYIKQHHKVRYTNLLTSGKLNSYLADIDKQAEDVFFRLVKQIAEREGVTEQLKADNQMEWVARMNNIRSRATEIVSHDIIYNQPKCGGREINTSLSPFQCNGRKSRKYVIYLTNT